MPFENSMTWRWILAVWLTLSFGACSRGCPDNLDEYTLCTTPTLHCCIDEHRTGHNERLQVTRRYHDERARVRRVVVRRGRRQAITEMRHISYDESDEHLHMREEIDVGNDGTIDQIKTTEFDELGGVHVTREFDNNGDGRIDRCIGDRCR